MDDDDLLRTGMEVVLRPVTNLADAVLGVAGGDWLQEVRARNRARLQSKTEEILIERGVKKPKAPSPNVLIPLLSAAQDELRDELQEIWARLLASASDPRSDRSFFLRFIEISRTLDPVDATVFKHLDAVSQACEETNQKRDAEWQKQRALMGYGAELPRYAYYRQELANRTNGPLNDVDVALENLLRLGLIRGGNFGDPHSFTALGERFHACLFGEQKAGKSQTYY
jgi:hypothetical protein